MNNPRLNILYKLKKKNPYFFGLDKNWGNPIWIKISIQNSFGLRDK